MFTIETGETNAILRKKSDAIKMNEIGQYRSLGQEMLKFVRDPDSRAAGLAAPQVGVNKRLIAVSLLQTYSDEDFRTIVMINPEILEHAEATYRDEEGCLSVPGEEGVVSRWNWIKVQYLDLNGKMNTLKLTGLAGRIVQHEVDHLDGILFTDKEESSENIFMKAL